MSKTIAAIATPPGEGGLAVIRISGADAHAIAAKIFRPVNSHRSLQDAKGYTALFGHFVWQGKTCDEVVALSFRAPHSYTGEDVVELSCHGGSTVPMLLLQACVESGASPAGPGEFTRRAFENGRINLAQAEAVMDLISATGRQGAAVAVAALEGALAKRIEGLRQQLTTLAGHLAAWIDFPEEDVPALEQQTLQQTLSDCIAQLQKMIAGYGAGAVLRRGVDTAIVGSPNVGKSTLFNLLSGFERAIVTPIAGTTRDVVEQQVQLGQVRLNLFDTAGLRQTDDVVEAEGIRRSYAQMDKAGLVLAVYDGSREICQEDIALAQQCQGRPALAILNKSDLEKNFDKQQILPYFGKVVEISAKDDSFLPHLTQAIEELLGVSSIDPDAGLLASQRQLEAATRAVEALQEAAAAQQQGFDLDAVGVCVDDALHALYQLTGEEASEAVVEEVFSKFCVGK